MKKLLITLLFSAAISIASAQAPANDNFANSQTISTGLTITNITNATLEANEPYATQGRTVWYSYTATSDSIVRLDSTGTAFEYHFAKVYLGTEINSLISIDGGTSGGNTTPFNFSFKAKAGSTYKICAGLYNGSFYGSGREVKLTLSTTPFTHVGPLYSNENSADGYVTNDRFDSRTMLAGNTLTAINYIADASVEAGELDTSTGRTAWYSYTATVDSIISIDTTGTEFEYHFVSIYMGTSIHNLIEITGGYSSGSTTPFTTSFKAKAGTTYQICTGCTNSGLYGSGALLQLALTSSSFSYLGKLYGPEVPTAPTPKNDSFYTPQVLSGNQFTVIGSAASATTEPGESGLSKTLWYSWTAASNKAVRVDFPAGTSGGFGAFTGTSPQTVVEVGKAADTTSLTYGFNAVAGTTYKLLIGATAGAFQFTLTASDPPVNHGPVSKITFPKNGQTVSKNGFNFDGTFKDADGDRITAYQFRVNGKAVVTNLHPSNESVFSGKLKKGQLTLQMRSKDSLGKWGPYHTIKVKAK